MEFLRRSATYNITNFELEQHASDRDFNSIKQTNGLHFAAAGSRSRHSIGNIILITLPICLVFIPTVFTSTAYVYAHVGGTLRLPKNRTVPFISDIGESQPQSNLFAFGLNIGAFCTAAVVVIRYFHVKCTVADVSPRINCTGLITGLLIAIGQVAVASFQLSGMSTAHYVGALVYSLSAVIFAFIQTHISYKENNLCGKYRGVFLGLRGLLSAGIFIGFLVFGIFCVPPLVKYNKGGFSVSQSGEWCFAGFKMLFMLTFIVDFWSLRPELVFEKS